ncbi:MAG: DUF711 family protein [Anaerolineaceae bacterium]|nr:DUF711 family protein [Anaerolineaceae bacterium]
MIIRSITTFMNVSRVDGLSLEQVENLTNLVRSAKKRYEETGYEVQTSRLATNSFSEFLPLDEPLHSVQKVQDIEEMVLSEGYDYLSLGPAIPELPESYSLLPEIFRNTETVFLTGKMINQRNEISLAAVRACAKIITEISTYNPNGFQNLYFSALANVPGGTPFFPSAYWDREGTGFALALEAADLAVKVFSHAETLREARQLYIERLESEAGKLENIGESLSDEYGVAFIGLDLTPAPFISVERSVGTALEKLGVRSVGLHGSLAAAAFLMDAIDRARYKKTGFNGLMLPILEDAVLAKRVEEGTLTIKDLLLMSSVCGTGLDTVPLSGDVSEEQIASILLDVASLSSRLNKPLTARLMPIPGKRAGEKTTFDFPFFANSCVMSLDGEPLQGLFDSDETFAIQPGKKG